MSKLHDDGPPLARASQSGQEPPSWSKGKKQRHGNTKAIFCVQNTFIQQSILEISQDISQLHLCWNRCFLQVGSMGIQRASKYKKTCPSILLSWSPNTTSTYTNPNTCRPPTHPHIVGFWSLNTTNTNTNTTRPPSLIVVWKPKYNKYKHKYNKIPLNYRWPEAQIQTQIQTEIQTQIQEDPPPL